MVSPKVLVSALGGFGIRVETGLVLLQEFLFNSDIMVSDAQDCQSIFGLLDFQSLSFLSHNFGDEFILDKNESLHSVLQCKLMLTHLTQNGTNIKVDIRWVEHL